MERETGFEPATSSLGSWHSTTELLPRSCIFRYLTVLQGFSRFPGQSIVSAIHPEPWGLIAKWTVKRTVNLHRQPTTIRPPSTVLCHFTTTSTYHNATPTGTGREVVRFVRDSALWHGEYLARKRRPGSALAHASQLRDYRG